MGRSEKPKRKQDECRYRKKNYHISRQPTRELSPDYKIFSIVSNLKRIKKHQSPPELPVWPAACEVQTSHLSTELARLPQICCWHDNQPGLKWRVTWHGQGWAQTKPGNIIIFIFFFPFFSTWNNFTTDGIAPTKGPITRCSVPIIPGTSEGGCAGASSAVVGVYSSPGTSWSHRRWWAAHNRLRGKQLLEERWGERTEKERETSGNL